MPSLAFQTWTGVRTATLREMEKAHRALSGSGSDLRVARQQMPLAYALLLSAQFQAFCRELHYECTDYLTAPIANPSLRVMAQLNMLLHRKLDRDNPTVGNLGADFNRLSLAFWPLVDAHHPRNVVRRQHLDDLCVWRNAIAHHDFTPAMLRGGRPALSMGQVKSWRRACHGLAKSFDEVLRLHILGAVGAPPW